MAFPRESLKTMFETYRPSGAFSPLFILYLVLAIVLSAAIAFLYELLLYWIPLIYITFLITIGFGFAVGVLGVLAINLGHVRNMAVGLMIGLLIGCGGIAAKYWFQYERFISIVADNLIAEENVDTEKRSALRKALKEEISFKDQIDDRVQRGWNLGKRGAGLPLSGVFVYLIWLIEFGIVVVIALALARHAVRQPYSEALQKWANEEQVVMTLPIDSMEMVDQIKNAGSIDDLLKIPVPKSDESNQFAVYTVNSVAGAEMEDAYLSVKLTTITFNDKGEEQRSDESLVDFAVLKSAERQQLQENAELLSEAIFEYHKAKAAGTLGTEPTSNPSDA